MGVACWTTWSPEQQPRQQVYRVSDTYDSVVLTILSDSVDPNEAMGQECLSAVLLL